MNLRFLFLFLITGTLLHAQELSYKFYGINEGLVQSQIICMFQDSKGFMWIGTKGGVSRFDGVEFRNFTENDGLINDYVQQIREDSTGTIWFYTQKGLSSWDGKQLTSFKTEMFFSEYSNECFYPSGKNRITIVASDKNRQIHYFLLKSGKYSEVFPGFPVIRLKKSSSDVGVIFQTSTKTLYLAAQNKHLYRIRNGVFDTLHLDQLEIKSLVEGRDGNVYLWAGIDLMKVNGNTLNKVHSINKTQVGLNNEVAVDSKGRIYDCEIHQHMRITDRKVTFYDNFKFSSVNRIFIDHEDNCWIGTETGLYRLQSKAFTNFIPEKCGINQNVWTVAEDRKGNIWFASYIDGLKYWNGAEIFKETRFRKKQSDENDFFYMGSLVDDQGNIWFPKILAGALKYDGKDFTPLFSDTLKNTILFMFQDPVSRVILGGAVRGLITVPPRGKPDFIPLMPGGGKSRSIVSIAKDRAGNYWLGGFDGISLYKDGKIEHLPSAAHPFDLGGNTMITDGRGNLWIGNKKGLFLYDYHSFKKISMPQPETMIMALTLIGDTGLLVGTTRGLAWLDLQKFYRNEGFLMHYFDKNNGFQGVEVAQNGFFHDSKGFIWIPTTDRVVRFDPRKADMQHRNIPCYLTSMDILNDKMEWVSVPVNQINQKEPFELSNEKKNIRFRFIGIDLSVPERIRYSFTLEGYDKGWSGADLRREAVYTNLPPGSYTLRLKAFDDHGNQSENEMNFKFRIIPAFWQTWWFWALVLIALAGFFFLMGFLVMDRRKRSFQEKLESEKKIAELQLISIRNQIDPHFTFNAMNSIASVILKEEKEKAYSFFVKLSNLIRQVLTSGDKITRTLAEELVFVQNYLEIEKLRFRDSFQFSIDIVQPVKLDQEVPKMVIHTYVENSLKHGLQNKGEGVGLLRITVSEEKNNLCIEVEDNGIGREQARKLGKESTGKGMMILNFYYDFFDRYNDQKILHQVTDLYNERNEPKGTRVTIIIPSGFNYNITTHETKRNH